MTDEVANLVLRDNELQTLAISVMENQKNKIVEQNIRLMEYLEKQGKLDRNIEFLPNNESLHSRAMQKQGLTRPELSVLLAYSKLYVFDDLISSNLPDDPYLVKDLILYFPSEMRKKFEEEIINHQLRREIIATFVSNSIVNRMGSTYYHRVKEETGMKGCDIARAYTIVRDSYDLRGLWDSIEEIGSKVSNEISMELYGEIDLLMERATTWYLRNCPQPLQTEDMVEIYQPAISEINKNLESITNNVIKKARNERLKHYVNNGVPKDLANKIANLEALSSATDIALVASRTGLPVKLVGQVYFEIGNKFKIGWLRIEARNLLSDSHWSNLATKTLIGTFFDQQMKLTEDVLKTGCPDGSHQLSLEKWLKNKKKVVMRYNNFINDLRDEERLNHSMLTVAVERVEAILNEK